MKYKEVLDNIYKGDPSRIPSRLLCIDPGETTGWAFFQDGILGQWGQIETVTMNKQPKWDTLEELFMETEPTHIVCEDYRVYAHKLERHSNSQVVTLRLIGGIDLMCYENRPQEDEITWRPLPLCYQMATQAKGFVTDDRLKGWDMWQSSMKHARDAIRHGLYYLIITNRPSGRIVT
jgi:hypothetical protein